MSILGSLTKTYYAEKKASAGEDIQRRRDVLHGEEFRAARPEQRLESQRPTDASVDKSSRPANSWMIKNAALDFPNLPRDFDPVLGMSQARRDIRRTGGLAEAVYRTAYWMLTGETLADS